MININDIKIGKTKEYHIGYLSIDRRKDSKLDNLAAELYARSTATMMFENHDRPVACTGEFALFQIKTERRVGDAIKPAWQYVARRIK